MSRKLIPVTGCWVKDRNSAGDLRGVVLPRDPLEGDPEKIRVKWIGSESQPAIIATSRLGCGFKIGMEVIVEGASSTLPSSHGTGEILRLRTLGDRDQALIEFFESGQRAWLPYEVLRFVRGVRHRWLTGHPTSPPDAERFRLRVLASAFDIWNENSGALSRLEIDPLPHQIHLVHHILSSGTLNWLIADDVGLGKTIETGMLLAALRHRNSLSRVLLVTPAGLTRQWKDELYYKFGFEDFEIYGEDFEVQDARQWKMHDFVIGSIDRLKSESHKESLLSADSWDLIIFDEGHRLSRKQYGLKYATSDRFNLAAELRRKTRSLLILSATPHQGDQSKFVSLLELLRPDRKTELALLDIAPNIIGEIVYRNYKADVTDQAGEFIFKGKSVNTIQFQQSEDALAFDKSLQNYLRMGYAASSRRKEQTLRAIGFVMTTYRKLAASSCAAIHDALERRLARLSAPQVNGPTKSEFDERFVGEWEELGETERQEFFDGEIVLLKELVAKAKQLRECDHKIRAFLDHIVSAVSGEGRKQKLLIFTEYRSTQQYIRATLSEIYGTSSVELINGSMTHEERRSAISRFEDTAQFLVSTEAGGEGINLQKQCHIMVNFDLPWNPMRLVQRIGRLYRYGQSRKVTVFNLHGDGSIDEDIISLMYSRLNRVVQDLCRIQRLEFNEAYADDILGEIAGLLDVNDILEEATSSGIERTSERIEEALRKAREAAEKQQELFKHAARYDPSEESEELVFTGAHLAAFCLGMFRALGIEVYETAVGGKLLKIRFPENVKADLGLQASRAEVTFDRDIAAERSSAQMLDATSPLLRYMTRAAKAPSFGGYTAGIQGFPGDAVFAGVLRWQDAMGRRLRRSFEAFKISGGRSYRNPPEFSEWLLTPSLGYSVASEPTSRKQLFECADSAANARLASGSNEHLHPEGLHWQAAAWVG